MLESMGTNIFRNCLLLFYKEGERGYMQKIVSSEMQKRGGHFSFGQCLLQSIRTLRELLSSLRVTKVGDNIYLLRRKGEGGEDSLTQKSTLAFLVLV